MAELNEEELFNEDNVPESNWFKFDKPGDRVSGTLVSMEFKKSNSPALPDQRVFVLKQKDGSLVNVGISMKKDYIIGRTNNIKLDDHDYLVGFEFKKEVASTLGKGYAPAKSIEVYVKQLPKALENEQF